jgi:hypothetical protein
VRHKQYLKTNGSGETPTFTTPSKSKSHSLWQASSNRGIGSSIVDTGCYELSATTGRRRQCEHSEAIAIGQLGETPNQFVASFGNSTNNLK